MRVIKRFLILLLVILAPLSGAWALWPSDELVPTVDREDVVDLHVHTAGIGAGDSGIVLSDELRYGYKFPFYLRAFGVTEEELESEGDVVLLRKISERVARSSRVSRAVVLAMDGVVDADGNLDRARTQFHVPGEFLERELPAFDNLLYGASINPYRKDAINRLERATARGAVLVKWIPGIMDIDPADERIIPFYDRLRELEIPLLSHAGQEQSFGESNDDLGDPLRLTLALERGVTVIAAHLASTGIIEGQDNFERLLPMFARYENLYADVSALTQVNRRGYLLRALAMPELHGRLVYGSDWPLQFFPLVSPWYQWPDVSIAKIKAILALPGQWDRDVTLKEAMGVPPEIFARTARTLRLQR